LLLRQREDVDIGSASVDEERAPRSVGVRQVVEEGLAFKGFSLMPFLSVNPGI